MLSGGRTVHSKLKVPIKLDDSTRCSFKPKSVVRNDSCHDDYGWKLDRNFIILRIFLKIEVFNQKYMSSKATLD